MENFYVKINEEFISITDLIKHYKVMKEQSIINEEFTKTLPKTITHNGIEMVLVPAGNFIYGSNENDPQSFNNEKSQQTIYLPDYYTSKYPITNKQYAKYKNNHIYNDKTSNHPVTNVSWYDAQEFCIWANICLPTEQQWEKAARGVDGRIYPWGDIWDENKCNCEVQNHITTEVTKYSNGISPYGCHDMSGNVWEWCGNKYNENSSNRVLRGGSWFNQARSCRCACRDDGDPVNRGVGIGFRVVLLPQFNCF